MAQEDISQQREANGRTAGKGADNRRLVGEGHCITNILRHRNLGTMEVKEAAN